MIIRYHLNFKIHNSLIDFKFKYSLLFFLLKIDLNKETPYPQFRNKHGHSIQ